MKRGIVFALMAALSMAALACSHASAAHVHKVPKYPYGGIAVFPMTPQERAIFATPKLIDQPQSAFRPLNLAELSAVSNDMRGAVTSLGGTQPEKFLKAAALASADPNSKAAYFLASKPAQNDLFQLTWTYQGTPLRMVRDEAITDISFPLVGESGKVRLAHAKAVVDFLVRLHGKLLPASELGETHPVLIPYSIHLPWPVSLNNGMSFSSAPKRSVAETVYWFERVDVMVRANTVILQLYNRPDVWLSDFEVKNTPYWLLRPFPPQPGLKSVYPGKLSRP